MVRGGSGGLVAKLCPTLVTPWSAARQAPSPWDSPGKNTGVGCHFLLQGIFRTQGIKSTSPVWPVNSLPLSHQGSPTYKWNLKK